MGLETLHEDTLHGEAILFNTGIPRKTKLFIVDLTCPGEENNTIKRKGKTRKYHKLCLELLD